MSDKDSTDDGLETYRLALASQAPTNSCEAQEKRTKLRARFLNVIEYLNANHQTVSPIELDFHRESSLTAQRCLSIDSNFSQLLVEDLQTHIGLVPTALIRTNDLTAISFSIPNGKH